MGVRLRELLAAGAISAQGAMLVSALVLGFTVYEWQRSRRPRKRMLPASL
jgi:hypothetical protein